MPLGEADLVVVFLGDVSASVLGVSPGMHNIRISSIGSYTRTKLRICQIKQDISAIVERNLGSLWRYP